VIVYGTMPVFIVAVDIAREVPTNPTLASHHGECFQTDVLLGDLDPYSEMSWCYTIRPSSHKCSPTARDVLVFESRTCEVRRDEERI